MVHYFTTIFTVQLMLIILIASNAIAVQNETIASSGDAKPSENEDEDTAISALRALSFTAMRVIQTLVADKGEKVNMSDLADVVRALSNAAVMLENPKILSMGDVTAEYSRLKQELANRIAALSGLVALLKQRLAKSEADQEILEGKLNDSIGAIKKLLEYSNEKKLGFTATITRSYITFTSSSPIKFDNVQLNEGLHYDPNSGIFRCPVNGTYFISVSLNQYGYNPLEIYLKINGRDEFYFYSYPNSRNSYNTVSKSGLYRCYAGQTIYLQTKRSGTNYLNGNMRSMMSVFLFKNLQSNPVSLPIKVKG